MSIKKFTDITFKNSASRWSENPALKSLYGTWRNKKAQLIRLNDFHDLCMQKGIMRECL